MKKTISLILAVILCLGLCACGDDSGNNQDETKPNPDINTEYVGEWKCMRVVSSEGDTEEYFITLNEDGTGSYDGIKGKWRYSKDNNWAVLEIDPGNVVLKLEEVEDTKVLKCYGDIYYRVDEFEEFGTETYTITKDNWQEFFELCMEPSLITDDAGKITDYSVHLTLNLRSEINSKLLSGNVTGEYQLTAPTVHSIRLDVYEGNHFTYNIIAISEGGKECTITESTNQATFDVTFERNQPKYMQISPNSWNSDSVEIEGNNIHGFISLYSVTDLLSVEGTITFFK
jgi:hypothetical protein